MAVQAARVTAFDKRRLVPTGQFMPLRKLLARRRGRWRCGRSSAGRRRRARRPASAGNQGRCWV